MKDLIKEAEKLLSKTEAIQQRAEPHSEEDVASGDLYHALSQWLGENGVVNI